MPNCMILYDTVVILYYAILPLKEVAKSKDESFIVMFICKLWLMMFVFLCVSALVDGSGFDRANCIVKFHSFCYSSLFFKLMYAIILL